MAKYYVAGIPFDDKDCLKHYGVPNMKWGKHLFGIDANTKYLGDWFKKAGQNIGKFTTNAINGAGKAAQNAGNWVGSTARNVGNAVGTAANNVGNWAGNAAKDASNWAGQAAKDVGNAANQANKWAGTAVNNAANFVTGNKARDDLQKAKNSFFIGRGGRVNAAQKAYDQTLPGAVEKAANGAKGYINSAGKWVSTAANDAQKWANQAGQDITKTAGNVGNAIGEAANNVGNWAGQASKDVGNAAQDAGKGIGGIFNSAKNWVGDRAKDVGNAASNAWNGVSNAAQDAGNWVGDRAKDVGNWAGQAGKDIGNAATNAWNGVSGAAQDAGNWVGDRAKDVGNLLSNADEKQKMQDLIDKHYDPETNTFDSDEAYRKFDEARTAYANHPLTAVAEAGNWVGDRAKDVGNAASDAFDDVSARARGAVYDIGNRLTGYIDRNTAQNLRDLADHQEDPNAAFYSPDPKYSPENLRKEAEEYQRKADNSLFGRIGNAANQAGQWIGDRAKDVGNVATDAWNGVSGAANQAGQWLGDRAQDVGNFVSEMANPHYQLDAERLKENYRNYLNEHPENLQSPKHEEWLKEEIKNDPQLRSYYEQNIKNQTIPEQRITEQTIPEQRIAEKQALGGFNSRPLTKEENEIELKRVNDRLNNIDDYYDHLRANNNPQWSNFTKQDIIDLLTKDRDHYQKMIKHSDISDKPEGVSDAFWKNYLAHGGTREQYDKDWAHL